MANVNVVTVEPKVTLELTWKEFQVLFGSLAACNGVDAYNSLAHRTPKHGSVPASATEVSEAQTVLYRTLKGHYYRGVF